LSDQGEQLRTAVEHAFEMDQPLHISAGGTKAFLGEQVAAAETLDVTGHHGIINYQPGELIVTVRPGTRLADLQAALAEHDQMLAFEPPAFGDVAAGLSSPARP